jgi:hypothetical protein
MDYAPAMVWEKTGAPERMTDKLFAKGLNAMNRVIKKLSISALFTMMLIAACAGTAGAQGSRKDDIVFNAQGRPMAGASVRVCTSAATGQPCTPLALIYSDAALTQALANPLSADGLGNYNFYAAPGRYEIEVSGPGIITKQIPNVILPSDPSTPTFTSVTTTSGISAFSLSLTGNLTVNGSTAVAGSLTVGGAPVPTANADNQWTAGQRFKGSIPWRDFTAYMPAGGCSSTNATDPDTTGTISSGSASLTLSAAKDFKNGCGITVLHGGATSSLIMPSSCSATATRTSNAVTFTCSAAHNMGIANPFGTGEGLVVSGCSDSSFNGTFGVYQITSTTVGIYLQTAANSSATGCTINFLLGWAHGITGATTYYYKFTACDTGGGCSTAVGPTTISNGNASLTPDNYNWLGWGIMANTARIVCIYRSTDNITYNAVGTSYTMGYTDRGLTFPVFPGCPATPPSSPTAQQLSTTIVSGGGTTSLTLAASASNTATSQNVYHDETSFLASCVADMITDQASGGEHGCLIPTGNFHFNSDLPTDRHPAPPQGATIFVDGTVTLNTWPWIVMSGWHIQGQSLSGSGLPGAHWAASPMTVGANVAAAFAIQSVTAIVHGFTMTNLKGNGVVVSTSLGYDDSLSGVDLEQLSIGLNTTSGGVPLVFDQNALFMTVHQVSMAPAQAGIPASILFTSNSYNGTSWCCVDFDDIFSSLHSILFEAPGGIQNTLGAPISFKNWNLENRGLFPTGGLIAVDTGNTGGTPGSLPGPNVPNIKMDQIDDADVGFAAGQNTLITYKGQGSVGSTPRLILSNMADKYNPLLVCSTSYGIGGCKGNPDVTSDTAVSLVGNQERYVGFTPGGYAILQPLVVGSSIGYGVTPSLPAWADTLPVPTNLAVTSTGAGSLTAGQYCMVVTGLDFQTTPGQTSVSPEVCQVVGASSSINLSWTLAQNSAVAGRMYSDYRLWYGTLPGRETNYVDTGIAPSSNATITYLFTSTAGNVGPTTVPTYPTAYLSWFYRDVNTNGCIYCADGSGQINKLGIGEPNPGAGVKLAVAGGTIQGEGGIQAGSDTAFNASPRGAYNAFLPNLTSAAATYQRMTLDKAVTVTRLQLVLGTAGAGCTTQSTVSVTDGTSPVTLTTANGTATYDSGAVSQNFAAAANLDIKIATAASGCTTAPQNANVTVQYRMQ